MAPRLLTVKQAAEYLNTSPQYIYNNWPDWCSKKIVVPIRLRHGTKGPSRLKFKQAELDRLIEASRVVIEG